MMLLLMLMLARIPTMLMLSALGMLAMIRSTSASARVQFRDDRWPARKVDVYPTGIGFRGVLKAQLTADLLNTWFDLLDVAVGVISPANDAMSVPSVLGFVK